VNPAAEAPRTPFWGYEDLALFASAILPSVALAALLLRATRTLAPHFFAGDTATTLAFQSFMYVFLLGALYLLISFRYRRPFWSSIGWTFPIPRGPRLIVLGAALAIGLSSLGVLLRAPSVRSPIEDMITSRASLAIVMLFGVLLAPLFEEMLFRGFLLPLLARSLGPWIGIFLTTLPFALLHGPQNAWAWQQVVLIGLAGAVFGYVRYRTESTSASFLLHAAYNATGFLGFAIARWQTLR
jgi:membrane protease YdiL (CAAX protease family)